MKFIIKLSLIIIATVNLALSKRSKTKSDFISTCRAVVLKGSNLSAECKRIDQSWMKTSVDLSSCVTNTYGKLKLGAAYDHSCYDCKLVGTATLNCNCKSLGYKKKNSSIDLNTFIANHDGTFSGCKTATSSPLVPVAINEPKSGGGNLGSGSGSDSSSSSSLTNKNNDPIANTHEDIERNTNVKRKMRKSRKARKN